MTPGATRHSRDVSEQFSWTGEGPGMAPPEITATGWVRAGLRGGAILALLALCFPTLLLLRPFEAALFGQARPITPYLTQLVCIGTCRILGLRPRITGRPMSDRGACVANHGSWLDIFLLNAAARIYFVAKAEVRDWGGIGWLARGTGTVFVVRARAAAGRQQAQFQDRLLAGHQLVFFPEATSTDTRRVLAFKSTPFAAFFRPELAPEMAIQPISVGYIAPAGRDARFYGWWGDMTFGSSLLAVLAQAPQGRVEVIYHPPLRVADFADRKALAQAAERAVRAGLEEIWARSAPEPR